MGWGNGAKEFFEEYRQRYLNDSRRFANNFKIFIEKIEGRVTRIAYQPYKWLVVLPLLVLSTFILGICAMIVSIMVNPRVGTNCGVIWARFNSFFTPMTVNIVGTENMEPGASYVITANHQSLYDIYVLYGWMGVDFKWVMKKELEKVPVLGPACKILGHIFIDRSDTKKAVESINAAKKKIVNGTSVIFFPEGSRSTDGVMKPFKKGAFKMALDLGLPILPVTINGTRKILPKGSIDLKPGGVMMTIHRPIAVKNYSEETLPDLMDKTRRVMSSAME
jgi:1-acyl-sn-glycerol-3-phosphate acyltransferase